MGVFTLIPTEIYSFFGHWFANPQWEVDWTIGGVQTFNNANVSEAVNICETANPIKVIRTNTDLIGTHAKVMSGPNINLDGNIVDRVLGIPPGFLITSFTWSAVSFSNHGGSSTWRFTQGLTGNQRVSVGTYQFDVLSDNCVIPTITETISTVLNGVDSLLFFKYPFGIEIVTPDGGGSGLILNSLKLTGTYILWSSQLTLNPGITPYTTSTPSTNKFVLTDGEGKLNQIENLYVTYIDGNGDLIRTLIPWINIEIITSSTWWFYIPPISGIPSGTELIIEAELNGVEFSGTVPLGKIYPILVRGSGIYTLEPGQKHDTYYNRQTTPATTVNMTIPNPFGKSGFFNG